MPNGLLSGYEVTANCKSSRLARLRMPLSSKAALHRPFLGELCRIVAGLLTECFNAAVPDDKPAFILFIQTFGDLVTFQPHLHAFVADGIFQENGVFRVLPPIPTQVLERGLREKLFAFLKNEGGIDEALIARMPLWTEKPLCRQARSRPA